MYNKLLIFLIFTAAILVSGCTTVAVDKPIDPEQCRVDSNFPYQGVFETTGTVSAGDGLYARMGIVKAKNTDTGEVRLFFLTSSAEPPLKTKLKPVVHSCSVGDATYKIHSGKVL